MLYDDKGNYLGPDEHMEHGYEPGDVVFLDGKEKVIVHADHIGPDTYRCTFEDRSSRIISHYGTPRHSGRYPWGSGENPYQRNESFLGKVDEMKKAKDKNGKKLFTEKQIAESMGMNTSELRKRVALANAENWAYFQSEAVRLKEKGMSTSAIARRMGRNESTVRGWLNDGVAERMTKSARNAQVLKDRLEETDGFIQIGEGAEYFLGEPTTRHNLSTTIKMLEQQGYMVHDIPIRQLGTGKNTTVRVLTKPGVDKKDVMKNTDKIVLPTDIYAENYGQDLRKVEPYQSIDSKRIHIAYPSEGGDEKDGVIELRRGVPDLNLGNNHYAQVRILVDGTHYLKGMAMYADDLPDGCDIRFNTSKPDGTPMFKTKGYDDSVLKSVKEGLENPFGANIKPENKLTKAQRHYIGEDGKEHLSALNIVKEEGDVNSWKRNLASQFLSKQPPELARRQLKMAYDISKAQLDEIASYDNPTVKAKMLLDFAGRCESDSVHLAAAALPRQRNKLILPLPDIKDTEIFAPGFDDGEQVALVRYPHAGGFEIPILTVNNQNKRARDIIGDAIDAVGINKKAAQRLSGADFDGDTALVIPVDNVKIRATANNRPKAYQDLEDFDTSKAYPGYPGMHVMTPHQKGIEMGKITNLITDMTFQRATDEEICRAVKHSMVVIDAEKHHLDFRRSERENHIQELREKYQPEGGASTLLSRSTSDVKVLDRKEKAPSKMSAEEKERWKNGEVIWEYTGKTRTETSYPKSAMAKEEKLIYKSGPEGQRQIEQKMREDGRAVYSQVKKYSPDGSQRGAEEPTYSLVSGGSREKTTPIERIYADHALAMKDLARQARKLAREQKEQDRDPEAAKAYSREVDSIKSKIAFAEKNKPLERLAQIRANQAMREVLYNHPEIKEDKDRLKRERGRQLEYARESVGAKKWQVGSEKNPLTDKEWEAIQKKAVSKTTLRKLLQNADMNRVKQLAMPKTKTGISSAKLARARTMLRNGYSRADIAAMLDISESTLVNAIENGTL